MDSDRRSLMTSGVLGVVAGLTAQTAATAAIVTTAPAGTLETTAARQFRQVVAAHQVSNCMNRYTAMESLGHVADMENEFATNASDVQVDVGFGWYYGATGVHRFCEVNGLLIGDANRGSFINGATFLFGNTSEIVEVAEDLKTAKGLWLTWFAMTTGNAATGFKPRWGCARRAVDFIQANGEWKIWHYFVYGLINTPPGQSWIDSDVVADNQSANNDWIPEALKPDRSSAYGIGNAGGWRPDRPMIQVRVPVSYRTFAETFSYARTL
jgi:hypothetical protein